MKKEYFKIPIVCPICKKPTSIHKDNNSEILYCDNSSCEGKLINIIDHFASKKGLDIKGFSKATIEKLIDWGWLGDRQSIFELKEFRNEWIKKSGFGVASVDKILNSIEQSKNTTLDKIIAAAGIPEIGNSVAKILSNYYKDWKSFRAETDYTRIEGIGDVMNDNINNFDYDEIDYIVENYLIIEKINDKINIENDSIKGKVFVITGSLLKDGKFKKRDNLKADIESKGGKVVGSVSSKTDYLIANQPEDTSKYNNALRLDVKIITECEYELL